MISSSTVSTKSWTAFDLNVLRRIRFASVAMPFTEMPALGHYLKRLDVRVTANDALLTAVTRAAAQIVNDDERLNEADVLTVLEDAYVPGYKLNNQALATWFRETDAWWFDNVRRNIQRLETPMKRALASSIAIATGEYALAFHGPERELRQPLSTAFRRLWSIQPDPFANGQVNTCSHKPPDDFIAESHADLMFLRLPTAHATALRSHIGQEAWAEEWLRGNNDFWEQLDGSLAGKLGSATETKSQYLHLLEETLRRASHMRRWAIAHVESGFIQTQDIVDTVASIRSVDTIYTKDFSELTGTKAVIITA
jgi:hypothetical protein